MSLEKTRRSLAEIDLKIIELIAQRQRLAAEIGRIKHREDLPVHDDEQEKLVIRRAFDSAVEYNINPVSIREIFEILTAMSEDRQHECAGEGNLP